MVQPSQGLDEHIDAFVPIFVATGCEEVQSVLRVELIMAVKVPTDKVVNLFFGLLMKVLELVHSRKLLYEESVRTHPVRFSLQEVLALVSSDI